MRRSLAWTVLAGALVATLVVGLSLWSRQHSFSQSPAPALASAIGGPFRLIDQSGAAIDQRLLLGKWTAVFFGYTSCPDVCPTTLAALGEASAGLGGNRNHFQVVFITVDPERDTPPVLARYLASATFPKGVIGLTGAPAQIAQAAHAYRVFYQKVPQGGSYVMDHTAVVYLMDPKGRFVEPLDVSVSPAKISLLINQAMG